MQQSMWPVDVICLTGANGEIRPLRVRTADGAEEMQVGNVCEILQTRESRLIGFESHSFLCRIRIGRAVTVMELRFFIRTHCWYMSRPGA